MKGLAEACIALAREYISKQMLGRANDNLQQAMDSLTIVITERKDISCTWKLLGDVCYRTALLPEKYCYLKVPSTLLNSYNSDGTALLKRRAIFLLSTR